MVFTGCINSRARGNQDVLFLLEEADHERKKEHCPCKSSYLTGQTRPYECPEQHMLACMPVSALPELLIPMLIGMSVTCRLHETGSRAEATYLWQIPSNYCFILLQT